MWTLFNYQYRDAGNFKARGRLALRGQIQADEVKRVEEALESGEFFIAEQVGVPPLQRQLQTQFGGRNENDHCWHSIEGWEVVEQRPIDAVEQGDIASFANRFARVERWREELSPEFGNN